MRFRVMRINPLWTKTLLTGGIALTMVVLAGITTPAAAAVPNPTVSNLEATNGPMAVASYRVPNPSGYGSGTVTYPTASGSYPGIVVMPGYRGDQTSLSWIPPRLASWGFVVINIGTNSPTDNPESRGDQISAAGTQLLNLGNTSGNPLFGKLNGVLGATGHSMGGGGTMAALRDDNRFRAGAPLAPYHPSGNFSNVTEPTFFLTCDADTVANGDRYAAPWYNAMTRAEKLYIEVPGNHLCPGTGYGNKAKQGKYLVAFFSRWLNNDSRFTPFLCGTQRNPDRNNPSIVTRWMDTCPF
jgi:dienelactone hydrolase